jgi:lipoprotein signal peptidase
MSPQLVSSEVLLGAWVATLLSLFIYSFLYKDNPLFKLAEHIFVGASVGYVLTITYHEVMLKKLYVPLVEQADWLLLIAAGLGLFMLARLVPAWAWLSRIAFAFILGISSGVAIPRFLSSFVLQQVQGTLKPLVSVGPSGPVFGLAELNTALILVGVVSVLFYFFFSVEHRAGTRYVARTGMYFLMVSFGAAFGYTVMARMSLLIGRFDELLMYASPAYGYASPIILAGVIVGLVWWERKRAGRG